LPPLRHNALHRKTNPTGDRRDRFEGTLRRRLHAWVRESRPKKADLEPHDLGRTFGTWHLQENPGQLIELAELMGRSNPSQARKYALSDAERARAGVAKL
jgi:integrase